MTEKARLAPGETGETKPLMTLEQLLVADLKFAETQELSDLHARITRLAGSGDHDSISELVVRYNDLAQAAVLEQFPSKRSAAGQVALEIALGLVNRDVKRFYDYIENLRDARLISRSTRDASPTIEGKAFYQGAANVLTYFIEDGRKTYNLQVLDNRQSHPALP